jgi:cell division septation protein DedD
MKKTSTSHSGFFNLRVLLGLVLCLAGLSLALIAFGVFSGAPALAQAPKDSARGVQVGASYHNDVSPMMRDLPDTTKADARGESEREANENPKVPYRHKDGADPVVQSSNMSALEMLAPNVPAPILNFDGIPFPGVGCNCAPPDTNGAVGKTQYVQIVNEGYQVFDKVTGASVLGPKSISSVWTGFGGVCETSGHGDPVMLYDHLADRWVISQFAGLSGGPVTDECVAVSTTADATGTYNRYGFHLGTNFFDYPHLSVWPDAYYMSMNVFNAAGTAYLGPQPFAFDRTKMLAGLPATFISPVGPLGGSIDPFLPADLDGATLPPAGAPNTFVGFPGQASSPNYTTYHFHVDFTTPANSTFTTFATPPAAAFTALCPTTRACVPQKGVAASSNLDGIGDRLMFRLAYRNFGDHEAVVSNYSVSSGGVAAVRWFELRNVTAGPVTVFQQSTYQPDTTWRWMGSAAMDKQGNLAIGFSASSSTINPQLRYAARLATDPINTLAQGEAHLFDGTGSQSGTGNRWGDYSSMSIDPVDDSTFWYTNEYYSTTATFNWRTRIGSFKIATSPTPTPTPSATPSPTPTATPPPTATPTPSPTPSPTPTATPTATPPPTATPTPTPQGNYSLSISPSQVSVGRFGGTATYTVAIARTGGFNAAVTFTISALPTGATATFTPNPASGNSSTLRIVISPTVARGTYPFTVTGMGGTPVLTRTATASFKKRN